MSKSTWIWIILGSALLLTGGIALSGVSPIIKKISEAIATAEGFYLTNSRSQRNNNPGDLTVDLTGTGIATDGPFVVYASVADGWDALYKQVSEMLASTSHFYNSGMTISEIAKIYSPDGWLNWANNVANYLQVPTDTPLDQIV